MRALAASAAIIALVLLLAAAAWLALSEPEVAVTQAPRQAGDPVRILVAQAPEIGDFRRDFNVNQENPFVPWNQRQEEIAAINRPRTQPLAMKIPPPMDPPKPVDPPKPPPKQFPQLVKPREPEPEAVGVLLHSSGRSTLIVRLGEEAPTPMESGQELAGWRLASFDAESATFVDPRGATRRVLITVKPTDAGSGGGGSSEGPAPAPQPAPEAPLPPRPPGGKQPGARPPTGTSPPHPPTPGRQPPQARVQEGDIPPLVGQPPKR